MVEHRARQHLLSQPDAATLLPDAVIDGIAVKRVFVNAGEHGIDTPYVTITCDSSEQFNTLDAAYHGTLNMDSLTINVYANSTTNCLELTEFVRDAMRDWSHAYGDYIVQTSDVTNARIAGRHDFGEGDEAIYVGTVESLVYYIPA